MSRSRNNALEFSSAGSVIVDATSTSASTPSGQYGAIQFLLDSTISGVNAGNVLNSDDLVGKTFGAGTVIYGDFSFVIISSGLIQVHRV